MKKALVLCGGGSLGSYEMGAWRFLEERGEHFDIVTGTSIGAVNGAMYAIGAYRECLALWRKASIDQVIKEGFNVADKFSETWSNMKGRKLSSFFSNYFKTGGVDIAPFKELVKKTVDPKKLKESKIVCGVVATEFNTRKEVDIVLNDQPEDLILPWLHASSACFPIFPVEKIKGKSYIDGGYCNNLPIDFAIKLGADEITAVLLHSVPKNPQHPELMSLPFVRTIRPSRDTGSILYFERDRLLNNMALGYQDAMKAYGEAWGFSYCFEKDEKILPLAKEISLTFIRDNLYRLEAVINSLFPKDMPRPSKDIDLFVRGLEVMASAFELTPYKTWSIKEITDVLLSKIQETSKNLLIKDRSNRRNSLAATLGYLYRSYAKKGKADWTDEVIKYKPLIAYIKPLLFALLRTKSN